MSKSAIVSILVILAYMNFQDYWRWLHKDSLAISLVAIIYASYFLSEGGNHGNK